MAYAASASAAGSASVSGLKVTDRDVQPAQMSPIEKLNQKRTAYDIKDWDFSNWPHKLPTLRGVSRGYYQGAVYSKENPDKPIPVKIAFIVSPVKPGPVYFAIDGVSAPIHRPQPLPSEDFLRAAQKAQAALNNKDEAQLDSILEALTGGVEVKIHGDEEDQPDYIYDADAGGSFLALMTKGANGALKIRILAYGPGSKPEYQEPHYYAGDVKFVYGH